jgi:hypothetical protein
LRSRYIPLNGALGPSVRALRVPSFKLTQPLFPLFSVLVTAAGQITSTRRCGQREHPIRSPRSALGGCQPRASKTWHREPLWPACASQEAQVLPRTCRSTATLRTRILISSISYAKVDALRQLPVGVAVRVDVSAR